MGRLWIVAFLLCSLNGALVTQVPELTLLLNGEIIPEHEALTKEDVGLSSNVAGALSVVTPYSGDLSFQQPDGILVPPPDNREYYWRTNITSLGNGSRIIRLTRREEGPEPSSRTEGVWRCSVPSDASGGRRVINFGLYSRGLPSNGVLTIFQNLTLTAVSSLLTEPPTYTLTARTTGGPPGSINWTIGSTVLTGNTMTLNTRSSATYTHRVTVTGRHSDPIVFTASNRRTSPAPSSQLSVPFPNPPTSVQATQVGDGQVQVTWTLPTGTIIGLSLSVTGQQSPTTLGSNETTHTVSNVVTGTQISVVSLSSLNENMLYSTAATTTVGMLLALPTPVISSSSALSSTSLRVEWSLSSGSGDKAADDFIITYTHRTCSSESGRPISDLLDGSLRTRDIDGLEEFSTYNVTVTAVYRFGGSNQPVMKESAEMEIQTSSAAPSSAPPGLTVQNVMATSVEVSWNELACLDQNGDITGYMIRYVGDSQIITDSSSGSPRTYTVEGLIPFTDYSFSVAAVNRGGTGPFSVQPVTIQTLESTPGEVDSLTLVIKFKSIVLSWSTPVRPNGIITQYQVTYSVNGMTTEVFNTMDNTTLNYIVSSLEPETNVTVTVRAFTKLGPGEIITINSSTLTAPPPVLNVQVSNIDGTSVRVTWNPLDIPEITGYRVYYSLSESRKRQSDGVIEVEGRETNSTTVGDLTSGATYTFTVVGVARLDGGNPIEGERVLVVTHEVVPPPSGGGGMISVGGIVAAVITAIVVFAIIVIAVVFIVYLWRKHSSNKAFISTSRLDTPSATAQSVLYTKEPEAEASPEVNIDVVEPEIEEFPQDTHVTEGESVFFAVKVKGQPQPTLIWYRDGKEIQSDYSQEINADGSLSLPSTEPKHTGVYQLVAKNSGGSAEREVKLFVHIEGEETPAIQRKNIDLSPVPLPQFGVYVSNNHDHSNRGFRDLYGALDDGEERPKKIGLSPEFKKLNRFANITVYDDHRVILKPTTGRSDCQREFINACYIDGYSKPSKFLVTQAPLPKTLVDFWRLVWQEKPPIIVMVTNLKEGNKVKCQQYWPEAGAKEFGPFKVIITDQQTFADYVIRVFTVSLTGSTERSLKVTQFHFTAWPDHGVPEYATPTLSFYKRIMSQYKPKRGPLMVHCSAGVGRTGTFIAIDVVLEQIAKEQVVDIAGAVNRMRHQRMKMVQTLEQYAFIHDAILESVTCGDTQIVASDLRMAIQKLQRRNPQTGKTGFESQFHVLTQVSPNPKEVTSTQANNNPDRNRNTQYLPADRWRVLLKGEQPDYIHAVIANGYKHQRAFIVAEGPLASTARNFWKMVYSRRCGVVVMLSELVENGQESSYQYWPSSGIQNFGEFTIDLIGEEQLKGFTIRTLSVLEAKSQKAHQVTQFHITNWTPDGGCSNLQTITDVIEEMAKVQRRTGNHPIVIHCNDTVTRSGIFCVTTSTIERCKTEGVVDVFQVVKALRVQKPGAVPTVEHYRMVFEAVLTYLDSFDTYANFQNV